MLMEAVYDFFMRQSDECRFFSFRLRTGLIANKDPKNSRVVFCPVFWGRSPWMVCLEVS